MFSLDFQHVSADHLNYRIQKHGKDRVPAVDLTFSVDVGADALNRITPGLRETIFRQPKSGDQLRIASENDAAAFTELRHPDVEPLKIKGEFPGYELEFVRNIAEEGTDPEWDTDAGFVDVTLKSFVIAGREGGTAVVSFKASISGIDFDDLGELARAVANESAVLKLTPPTATQQESEPGTGDGVGAEDVGTENVPAAA